MTAILLAVAFGCCGLAFVGAVVLAVVWLRYRHVLRARLDEDFAVLRAGQLRRGHTLLQALRRFDREVAFLIDEPLPAERHRSPFAPRRARS